MILDLPDRSQRIGGGHLLADIVQRQVVGCQAARVGVDLDLPRIAALHLHMRHAGHGGEHRHRLRGGDCLQGAWLTLGEVSE